MVMRLLRNGAYEDEHTVSALWIQLRDIICLENWDTLKELIWIGRKQKTILPDIVRLTLRKYPGVIDESGRLTDSMRNVLESAFEIEISGKTVRKVPTPFTYTSIEEEEAQSKGTNSNGNDDEDTHPAESEVIDSDPLPIPQETLCD